MNPTIPEKLTKMKRQHVYKREKDQPWANGCIYCNRPGPLTLEHIIPDSIGGMLTIPNASCDACSDDTHAFEGHACRPMLPMRRQLGFPQKHRGAKDREKRKAERFVLMLDEHKVKVPIEEFPALLMSLVFPLPGILLGQKLEDKPLSGGIYSAEILEGFGEKLNRIKAKYRANKVAIMGIEPSPRGDGNDYGRMLAKIGHAYAAAELGCGNFHPDILHIIKGVKPYCLTHFIGSGLNMNNLPSDDLHEISLATDIPGAERFVVVKLRLFSNRKTPTHYVVVGRRL